MLSRLRLDNRRNLDHLGQIFCLSSGRSIIQLRRILGGRKGRGSHCSTWRAHAPAGGPLSSGTQHENVGRGLHFTGRAHPSEHASNTAR
eukprot:5423709-Pleurochrysis_carterae.AAC.1